MDYTGALEEEAIRAGDEGWDHLEVRATAICQLDDSGD